MTSNFWKKLDEYLSKFVENFGKNMLAFEGIYVDEYGKVYSKYLKDQNEK